MYALGHELSQTGSHKFDLQHMRLLLEDLGNPHHRFPAVLIAGTNGKGSTAATLAAILQASKIRVGLYTSPHLIHIRERVRVEGAAISQEDFTLLYELADTAAERLLAQAKLPWHPSFFEMMTAIAFLQFAEKKVELAILEVGMGGRLDATNVVEPLLSVVADISLDHQNFLGDTIGKIAREKAGIIRENGIVVTLPQLPEANDVVGNRILELGARGVSAVPYVPPVSPNSASYLERNQEGQPVSRYPLQVMGETIRVETPLVGRHQLRNVALAIAAAEELAQKGFSITSQSIERGIPQTQWPGRFQVIVAAPGNPEYVLDVAHNPAGAWALRSTLTAVYGERRLVMVFGAMRDKAIAEVTEIIFTLAEHIIATQADNPRAATPQEIAQAASRACADIEQQASVELALQRAREVAGPNGLVVITGSIYLVGEAMRLLKVQI